MDVQTLNVTSSLHLPRFSAPPHGGLCCVFWLRVSLFLVGGSSVGFRKLSFAFRVYGLGFRVLSIRGLGLLTLQSSASGLAISAGILKKLPR